MASVKCGMRPFTLLIPVLLMLMSATKADAAELLPIKINGLDAVLGIAGDAYDGFLDCGDFRNWT